MPTLETFGSWKVQMFSGDHNPPHVHACGPDWRAVVTIRDRRLIKGAIPVSIRTDLFRWIDEHTQFLLAKWTELNERDD